ncbi:MAG: HlyC/CorC family transporter [Parvibaculaceae bacterium]|nr:HlyC/CorC family transporter [Parvibaculaceae bacterium]
MSLELGLTLAVVIALVVVSAFFSGSETAITAASRATMHKLAEDGNRRARLVRRFMEKPEQVIGALLLGNNAVNILSSALATSALLTIFGRAGIVYATILVTILVLIFGEVMPKTYAIANPDRVALAIAPALRFFIVLFSPVTLAVQFIVKRALRLLGVRVGETIGIVTAHDELRGAIDLHHREGGVIKDDRDMLGGILDLRELEVTDIMVHRKSMEMIDAGLPMAEIVNLVLASPYTRLPLWREEPDNIVGILHVKDLLRAIAGTGWNLDEISLKTISTKPWFIPEYTSLQDQLNAFLRRKAHFALVVDEYGALMGLITLEDILEEIVGNITDEHDIDLPGARPQADGSVIVDGSVPIRDLNRTFDWQLPDDEAVTIAGLVIHEAQAIPDLGQTFTFYGYRFTIVGKQINQITSLRIMPLKARPANPPLTGR